MNRGWRNKQKNGFTLPEMLMTVIIVSLLSAVAIPRYMTFMKKMKNGEAVDILIMLFQAELSYKKDKGSYTSILSQLDIDVPALKHFKNLSLNTGSVSCGGTSRPVLAELTVNDDSYKLLIRENGVVVCSCGVAICQNMGYPATW